MNIHPQGENCQDLRGNVGFRDKNSFMVSKGFLNLIIMDRTILKMQHASKWLGGRHSFQELLCHMFKKNLNGSKPSEHPPSGEKMSKIFRWEHWL